MWSITRIPKQYTLSGLQRTQHSIQGFLDDGLEFERLEGRDVICWGSQEGVKFSEESKNLYLQTVQAWRDGHTNRDVAGGESPEDVVKRQKLAINRILKRSHEKLILVCMHGRAIRILMSWILNYDLQMMDQFPHSNLGLYKLFWTGASFQVLQLNDVSHLSEVQS